LAALSIGMIAAYAAGNLQGRGQSFVISPSGRRRTKPSIHKPPLMPLAIDGKEVAPESIQDFNGHPLYTVLDRGAQDKMMLQVFSDIGQAMEYCKRIASDPAARWSSDDLHSRRLVSSPIPMSSHIPPGGGYVDLYDDVYQGGTSWRLLEWDGNEGDFAKVCSSGIYIGWPVNGCFPGINADNRASSVDCRISLTHVVLADGINLGGSWLVLPAVGIFNDLNLYSWNDRASSMMMLNLLP
jgi:hypothetical protein